uniref:RNase H type-1 domain-containing protein n=1 Tax=Cajanus cajan TaxID=3821 RepID=A0A151SHJ8_CAJCA|nr:hypothetical protein KK1_000491 [Cajanus cajan]
MGRNWNVSLLHVHKEANSVANNLTAWGAKNEGINSCWDNPPNYFVLAHLDRDSITIC